MNNNQNNYLQVQLNKYSNVEGGGMGPGKSQGTIQPKPTQFSCSDSLKGAFFCKTLK